jgi:hypothetical protein
MILCSIVLGIETAFPAHLAVFQAIDMGFTAFFVVEILLRLVAESNPIQFFKLFCNYLPICKIKKKCLFQTLLVKMIVLKR